MIVNSPLTTIIMKQNSPSLFVSGLIALGIGTFFVLFVWNIWQHGINALGINFMVFWLLIVFFYILTQQKRLSKKSISWLIPLVIIILSLGIYNNPFTSIISMLILPIIFFIFTTHESHQNIRRVLWSKSAPLTILSLFFNFLASVIMIPSELKEEKTTKTLPENNPTIIGRVILGIVLLFIISIAVIIPLLSLADESFANIFKGVIDWVQNLLKNFESVPIRILVATTITALLTGGVHYWRKKIKSPLGLNASRKNTRDSIVIGIILSGILLLYLLFIGIQIHTLFISHLPNNFKETENLVKSGFWQLFVLTLINTMFYVGVFRKSTVFVQRILSVFTLASLLLIVSAAHRVFLYVTIYGLSYEKFFAFYTVIFCSIVFVWFLSLFTYHQNKPVHIVKTLSFLALWMYALATILPLEQIIFNTNLKLTQQENSRVDINELRMLGFDALPSVERNFDTLIIEARKDYFSHNRTMPILVRENYTDFDKQKDLNQYVNDNWQRWIEKRQKRKRILITRPFKNCAEATSHGFADCTCKDEHSEIDIYYCKAYKYKKWYEQTFKELFYKPIDIDFASKKTSLKEPSMRTFKNSLHGFSVNYPKDLYVTYDDSRTLNKLLNERQTTTFIDGENKLYISANQEYTFLNSNTHTNYLSKTREFVEYARNYHPHAFMLPNLKQVKSYAIFRTDKIRGGMGYKLLIDAPHGILVVDSNTPFKGEHAGVWDLTTNQYIARITPSKKLQNVIKSIRIIETKQG